MAYRTRLSRPHDENVTRPFSPFDGLPRSSARALERWFDALHELTLDDWMLIARAGRFDGRSGAQRAAQDAVVAIIADRHLEVTAWFIRDLVATAIPSDMRLASARSLAEWATLAVATRAWLAPIHHDALCNPFKRAEILAATSDSRILSYRRTTRPLAGDQRSRSLERED